MSTPTSIPLSMDLDGPAPTSGVAASMHAPSPSNIPSAPSNNSGKRNRTTAGIDDDSDEDENDSANLVTADLEEEHPNRHLIVTAPLRNRRYAIDGVHPRPLFYLLTPTGRNLWISAPNNEHAICAYVPGEKWPEDGDPSRIVRTVYLTVSYITQNNNIDVYPATPDDPADGKGALYVLCYLVNLTENDKITLLSSPIFSTPVGKVATLEFDFDPNPLVGTWGRSCLTDNPTHVLALQETVKALILQPGSSVFRALHRMNDRIPIEHNTSPTRRAQYIASTVEIIPINLRRREHDGSHTDFTAFNIYIESPTSNHTRFTQWLDILGRLSFRTRWGTVLPLEPFLCAHCGSRAHPSGLCPYLTDVAGFQATTITNTGHQATSGNAHRGAHRGRGRGMNRGRGYARGRGF